MDAAKDTLRVRHHGEHPTVGSSESGKTIWGTVGIVRVACRYLVLSIDVAQGSLLTGLNFSGLNPRKFRAALTVGNCYWHDAAYHIGKPRAGVVLDPHHDCATFELFAAIAHKGRPKLRLRNELAQLREHLATITDTQRERVGSKEIGKLLAQRIVE